MKNILLKTAYGFTVLAILVLPTSLMFMAPVVQAAQDPYVMLTPIPSLTKGGQPCTSTGAAAKTDPNCIVDDPGKYIANLVKIAIVIAGALAVLEVAVGGLQYLSTDAVSGKSEGKERIKNAIYGLLLAIGAYAILYSINPNTLNLNLGIQPIYRAGATNQQLPPTGGGCPPADLQPDGSCLTTGLPPAGGDLNGQAWPAAWGSGVLPDDASERLALSKLTVPIGVNSGPCSGTTIVAGAKSGCTSLDGLSNSADIGLKALSVLCQGKSPACTITITGGTEFWMHCVPASLSATDCADPSINKTAHIPGGGAVDIAHNGPLDTIINAWPLAASSGNGCENGVAHISPSGAIYVNEDAAHWHVCY